MPRSIPLQVVQSIPDYVLSSEEMSGWLSLNAAVEELARQAAVLSIREWFQARPHWSKPFKISLSTSEGIIMINAVREVGLSIEQWVEIKGLAKVLDTHVNYHAWPVINHMIVMLNALSWDPKTIEGVMIEVLDKHTKIGGAKLLAQVDAARLEGATEGSVSGCDSFSRL